jgi:hypothetical protein
VDLDPSQVAVVGHDMAGLVDEVQSRPRANRDGVASLKTLPSLTELIGDPHQPAKRIPDDRFANAATDLTTVDRDPSLAMCEIRGAPGRYLRTNNKRPMERMGLADRTAAATSSMLNGVLRAGRPVAI